MFPKDFPVKTSYKKADIYKYFNRISTSIVRKTINSIISEERKIPVEIIKNQRDIYKHEAAKIIAVFSKSNE